MPPAARLSLAYNKPRMPSISIAPARFRVQGWDPLLIISQIVSLQCLHYLSLALILPILLRIFASPTLLAYEGGASSVSVVMDWREFSGVSTVSIAARPSLAPGLVGLASAVTKKGPGGTGPSGSIVAGDVTRGLLRVIEPDPMRGWAVALGWAGASAADVFWLYHLIRRPTHILDFSLTLIFNHLILTTYYSSSFPSSFFFWFVVVSCTVAQIVTAEQMCISREMREGFAIDTAANTPIPPTPDHLRSRSPLPSIRGGGGGGGVGGASPALLGIGTPGSTAAAAAAAAAGGSGSGSARGKEDIELARFKSPNLEVMQTTGVGGHQGNYNGSGGGGGGGKYERVATSDER